jgi:hypothetical protein
MPTLLHSHGPAVFGSTTMPTKSWAVAPGVIANPNRHSGGRYPHLIKRPGADPRVIVTMPFAPAYDELGLGLNVLSAFEIYLAKFEDYERSSGSVHTKWSLASGASVAAMITGAGVDQDGDLMANVECILLGPVSGMTHPLVQSNGNALPVLASQPALHTLGPMSLNGTLRTGLMSHSFDRGMQVVARRTDGSKFPVGAQRLGSNPKMMGEHSDPVSLLGVLGLLGIPITSNLVQYFRRYDGTSGEVLDTAGSAISITAAAGLINPTSLDSADLEIPRLGFEAHCLSEDNDDPFVVSTSATVPALS